VTFWHFTQSKAARWAREVEGPHGIIEQTTGLGLHGALDYATSLTPTSNPVSWRPTNRHRLDALLSREAKVAAGHGKRAARDRTAVSPHCLQTVNEAVPSGPTVALPISLHSFKSGEVWKHIAKPGAATRREHSVAEASPGGRQRCAGVETRKDPAARYSGRPCYRRPGPRCEPSMSPAPARPNAGTEVSVQPL